MSDQKQTFLDRWDEHVHRLIHVTAKKADAVDVKHQQIVEGACKVFFEKGFHPASIREIAKASGMSMGQMYHYISSKDDVLFLIHRHSQIIWHKHLTDANLDACENPIKKMEKALEKSIEFLFDNKDLFQLIYTESKYLSSEHLKVVLEMDEKNVTGFWCDLVGEVFEYKGIQEDVKLAGNVVAYNLVFVALRGWNLKDKPKQQIIDSLGAFVLKGLGLP